MRPRPAWVLAEALKPPGTAPSPQWRVAGAELKQQSFDFLLGKRPRTRSRPRAQSESWRLGPATSQQRDHAASCVSCSWPHATRPQEEGRKSTGQHVPGKCAARAHRRPRSCLDNTACAELPRDAGEGETRLPAASQPSSPKRRRMLCPRGCARPALPSPLAQDHTIAARRFAALLLGAETQLNAAAQAHRAKPQPRESTQGASPWEIPALPRHRWEQVSL